MITSKYERFCFPILILNEVLKQLLILSNKSNTNECGNSLASKVSKIVVPPYLKRYIRSTLSNDQDDLKLLLIIQVDHDEMSL